MDIASIIDKGNFDNDKIKQGFEKILEQIQSRAQKDQAMGIIATTSKMASNIYDTIWLIIYAIKDYCSRHQSSISYTVDKASSWTASIVAEKARQNEIPPIN